MNIWSLQASSRDYKIVTAEAEAARELIAHHNDLLQRAIDEGWDSLSRQMKISGFFNDLFYRYVTQKFAETDFEVAPVLSQSVGKQLPQAVEKNSGPSGRFKTRKRSGENDRLQPGSAGVVESDQYCLGFSRAFEPLRPPRSPIF